MLQANGIQIAHEALGPDDAPVILLIHGLGVPLSGWPQALLDNLVASGFRVVMLDNRDIGRSQRLDHLPAPNVAFEFLRGRIGLSIRAPYQLQDMMQDVVAALDALHIEKAHVVGASMGGMISQLLAIHAPQRVRSLTSIMSTTGRRTLPGPRAEVRQHLLRRPRNATPEELMEYGIKTWKLIGSPGYPKTREQIEDFLRRVYDRGVTSDGVTRQLLAIMASPDRVSALAGVTLPSLVLHGDQDPLVPLACGTDTAMQLANATMHVYPGMGHDLPEALIDDIAARISEHASRAERAGKGSRAA